MCEERTRKESRDETRKVVGSLSDLNVTSGKGEAFSIGVNLTPIALPRKELKFLANKSIPFRD
jgi:hypothetical protein